MASPQSTKANGFSLGSSQLVGILLVVVAVVILVAVSYHPGSSSPPTTTLHYSPCASINVDGGCSGGMIP